MDKQIFLEKLQNELERYFSLKDIKDILADYKGFFADGLEEGKPEEQICNELGNPVIIAKDLAAELNSKRPYSAAVIRRVVFAAALLISVISYFIASGYRRNYVESFTVWVIAVSALLWLASAVVKTPLRPARVRFERRILICHCAMPFGVICYLAALIWLASILPNMEQENIMKFGVFLQNSYRFLLIAALLVCVWGVFNAFSSSRRYILVSSHAAGVIAYLGAIYQLLSDMNTFDGFMPKLLMTLIPYVLSAALTTVFALLLHRGLRRAK